MVIFCYWLPAIINKITIDIKIDFNLQSKKRLIDELISIAFIIYLLYLSYLNKEGLNFVDLPTEEIELMIIIVEFNKKRLTY